VINVYRDPRPAIRQEILGLAELYDFQIADVMPRGLTLEDLIELREFIKTLAFRASAPGPTSNEMVVYEVSTGRRIAYRIPRQRRRRR
jgi:hypothetical protein